jgi:tetratricopeptide (TPR) repeat protein
MISASHCTRWGGTVDAADAFRAAIALTPDFPEALNNLSACQAAAANFTDAIALARRATEINPQYADAFNNLGNALNSQGRAAEAVASYRRAVELQPTAAQPHSNLLLVLHYLPGIDPAAMFAEHKAFGRQVFRAFEAEIPESSRSEPPSSHRLRLVRFSPAFRRLFRRRGDREARPQRVRSLLLL